MKILYTPLMIVPSVSPGQRAAILEAAGPGSTFVRSEGRRDPAARDRRHRRALRPGVARDPQPRQAPALLPVDRRRRGLDPHPGAGGERRAAGQREGGVGIHLAEHAFALLLALTRGLHTAIRKPDYSLREPIRLRQLELYDLTMGIVGFGGTGREVARGRSASACGCWRSTSRTSARARRRSDLEAGSDGRFAGRVRRGGDLPAAHEGDPPPLHPRSLPQDEEDRVPDQRDRGAIVYGDDLVKALDEEMIGGAGLDVTDPEPLRTATDSGTIRVRS